MTTIFLEEDENFLDLASRVARSDLEDYESFKSLKKESAFDGRIFVVYKPRGLDARNRHRDPEILTTLRVLDFRAMSDHGAIVRIEDTTTGAVTELGYVPKRVFDYDLFMSVPPRMRLHWDARVVDGVMKRSMSYILLIKTKNRSDWFSAGVTYCETQRKINDLFPDLHFEVFQ